MAAGSPQTTNEVQKGHSCQVGNFGANGAVPQTAVASGGAVATTAPTNASPYGFTTSAQAAAIITLLNNIQAALVACGIMS